VFGVARIYLVNPLASTGHVFPMSVSLISQRSTLENHEERTK